MSFTICTISTAEAIVPIVKSFEWGRSIIALHSIFTKTSIGVVSRSITISTSLSTLCHSKTMASVGGVTLWHQGGGGIHGGIYCIVGCISIGLCCGGKDGISGGWGESGDGMLGSILGAASIDAGGMSILLCWCMCIAVVHLVLDLLEFLHDGNQVSESWLMAALSWACWAERLTTAVLHVEIESSSVALLACVSLPKEHH